MKTARFIEMCKIQINDEPTPKPGPEEILIKVQTSGVCGTDLHIYEGKVKGLVKPGTVLGHEFAGIVEEVGVNVKNHKEGDRVAVEPNLFCGSCHFCRNAKKHFCENWKAIGLSRDGGFADYCVIPASAAYIIPNELDFKAAAFFEPMACVLHGIERARIKVGETVVLQGAGSIGLLYVQALKRLGATKIIVSDIDSPKLYLAKKLGAHVTVDVKNQNIVEIVKEETNGRGAQVMIDAAGILDTVPLAFQLLENTGRVLIFGVPPEKRKIEIIPFDIYRREIEIIGSFTNPYTNEAALEILTQIDIDQILTNPISLNDLVEKGLKLMGKPGVLKVQVQF